MNGNNITIKENLIYDNLAYGIQLYGAASYNPSQHPSAEFATSNNWVVEKNTIAYNKNRASIVVWGANCNNLKFDNNIAYENSVSLSSGSTQGVDFVSMTSTGILIRNNHFYASGSGGTVGIGSGATAGVHYTATGNITNVSAPDFVNAGATLPGSPDFTLTSSSPVINAGTTATGIAYNGSAPDIGAFETFTHSVCTVEDGDANTLRVTVGNNLNPPIQNTNTTGWTVKVATVSRTLDSVTKVGDNRVDIVFQGAAVTGGQAVTYSYAQTGDFRDSANIGRTFSQEYLARTDESCTNNVGAAPTHVFTQARYEFHGRYGTEAAPIIKPDGVASTGAAENFSNMTVIPGGSVRVRFAVTCTTADCPPAGFVPRYSKNGGAYTVVPDAFTADNISLCGVSSNLPNNGTATTDQLSTSGAFAAGAVVLTSNAIPTVDIALNGKTELEYCFTFDTDAASGDYYDFRLYDQDGSTITYTVTPRITVNAAAGGFGQLWELLMFAMLPALGRIESQTAKPVSNLAVSYPNADQVLIDGLACTSLKTSGTGLKRTITCGH
jgi:hypothetical protein